MVINRCINHEGVRDSDFAQSYYYIFIMLPFTWKKIKIIYHNLKNIPNIKDNFVQNIN